MRAATECDLKLSPQNVAQTGTRKDPWGWVAPAVVIPACVVSE
jgi:hypothetical protein